MLPIIAMIAFGHSPDLSARPFTPRDDSEVLLDLPPVNRALRRSERAPQTRIGAADTLQAATQLVRDARASGDPRLLGQAEALLNALPGSLSVRQTIERTLLEATLLQADHHFDASIAKLDTVFALAPGQPQALLLRSAIYRVQGRYEQALADCVQLATVRPGAVAQACVLDLRSLMGDAGAFAELKRRALLADFGAVPNDSVRTDDASLRWVHTVLAEIADRNADALTAEASFRRALAGSPSVYLQTAYGRWLLDEGRVDEALASLRAAGSGEADAPDAMLLAYATACRRAGGGRCDMPHAAAPSSPALSGADGFDELKSRLSERFDAADRRGSGSAHARERAYFELDLQSNPKAALAFALQNWNVQREPADARLLARAAIAANDSAAIIRLRRDLQESGLHDRRLDALLMAGIHR